MASNSKSGSGATNSIRPVLPPPFADVRGVYIPADLVDVRLRPLGSGPQATHYGFTWRQLPVSAPMSGPTAPFTRSHTASDVSATKHGTRTPGEIIAQRPGATNIASVFKA